MAAPTRQSVPDIDVQTQVVVPLLSRESILYLRTGLSATGVASMFLGYCLGFGPAYFIGLLLIAAALAAPDKVFNRAYRLMKKVVDNVAKVVEVLKPVWIFVASIFSCFWLLVAAAAAVVVLLLVGHKKVGMR